MPRYMEGPALIAGVLEEVQLLSLRRLTLGLWLAALLAAVPLLTAGTAGAAIAPPWCGTPMTDAAENLPSTGTGNFPHIPYYAIKCTLDDIAARSNGRMKVEVIGQSALGRDMFSVTINDRHRSSQRRDYSNWQKMRRDAIDDPDDAQRTLRKVDEDFKIPLYIQGGIHGNEFEGVDSNMVIIEKLATTPYGTDPEVDTILDHSVVVFNVIQNPDGRIAGVRTNGNGFDLNRDFLTQSQSETRASVGLWQTWLPPDHLDLHGYLSPVMLIEATTKPHNPGIDYDFWLKWNQTRIDANEAALNAQGFGVQRPINDWCGDAGDAFPYAGGMCPTDDDITQDDGKAPGPSVAEGWDDWGPFYTPMYGQLVGMNGSTVEMCNTTSCGGRLGARQQQEITTWSTLLYNIANREEVMTDLLEIYDRGVDDDPRPACCPPPFHEGHNWMVEYPKAYVIPMGRGQRSDAEARRLAQWLLDNGIEVHELDDDYRVGSRKLEEDSFVVWMDQAHRGLAFTALDVGLDVTGEITILYAPPAAWSHGSLWGADVLRVEDSTKFRPDTDRIRKISRARGDLEGKRATAYALALDSATAVRTANGLLADGVSASATTVPFSADGNEFPAGSILFPASAKKALEDAAEDSGLDFQGVRGTLPASEPIDGAPSIAVLNGNALTDQSTWVLRELGFTATPINVAALNGATDPLVGKDLIFNTAINYPGNTPGNATARARLTAFFAGRRRLPRRRHERRHLPDNGAQVGGLTAVSNSGGGAGYSGIFLWENSAPGTSVVTGAYPASDTAIFDPPTWFTSIPTTMTKDGALPGMAGFFLAGLWPDSASAAGATVIAHGTNTAGSARLTSFAMNPLYRADPEREWPMLASAAYWVDQ